MAAVALKAPAAAWVVAALIGVALILYAVFVGADVESPLPAQGGTDAGSGSGDVRGNVFGDHASINISHSQMVPEAQKSKPMVRLSVGDLVNLYREHTQIQAEKLAEPYLGGWLEVHAPVNDVARHERTDGYRVSLFVDDCLVSALFVPEMQEQLPRLRREEPITLVGQIERIGLLGIDLGECELREEA